MGEIFSRGDGKSRPAALALAGRQYGRISRRQLLGLGIPASTIDSWLRSGRLVRVCTGVYAFPPLQTSREASWMAAVLACSAGAALGGLSAAAHLQLTRHDGERIEVVVPRGGSGPKTLHLHRPRRMPATFVHDGIRTTTAPETLLALAVTFTDRNLERALGEAELLRLLAAGEPERTLAANPRHPGAKRLRRVLAGHDAGDGIPRNVMELAFRDIVRELGLPEPVSNERRLGWQIDFLWPELMLAAETDGRSVHARRIAFAKDRRKDRELQLAGYVVLRFTYAEIVHRPEIVRAALLAAVARR